MPQGGGGAPLGTPPPIPGCYPVLIASDSEGLFGQQCPACHGYWRCRGGGTTCPDRGPPPERHNFPTAAPRPEPFPAFRPPNGAPRAEKERHHAVPIAARPDP